MTIKKKQGVSSATKLHVRSKNNLFLNAMAVGPLFERTFKGILHSSADFIMIKHM